MHPKVQKWTSTTLPRSEARESGSELIQSVMPVNSGAGPRSFSSGTLASCPTAAAAPVGSSAANAASTSGESSTDVSAVPQPAGRASAIRAWTVRSRPVAIRAAARTIVNPADRCNA